MKISTLKSGGVAGGKTRLICPPVAGLGNISGVGPTGGGPVSVGVGVKEEVTSGTGEKVEVGV